MPYPNEHACRLRDPGDFQADSFRRTEREHEGRVYSVIMGRLKGEETMTEQAYRYDREFWPESDARAHCGDHDGAFEPAADGKSRGRARELRSFRIAELRVLEDDGQPRITGYAAVFDELSDDLGGFREKIRPGAFAKTLREADVRALRNHNSDYVLGRTKNGTLTLREDQCGLAFEIIPPDTQWARDLLISIQRRDIDQMSFGFRTIRDTWQRDANDEITRELIEAELYDVSPVTFPAYPQTSAEVRARLQDLRSQPPDPAPPQEGHPGGEGEPDPQVRIDLLRRRLDLAEAEFIHLLINMED